MTYVVYGIFCIINFDAYSFMGNCKWN